MTNLRKPTLTSVRDPDELQIVLQGMYDALAELQGLVLAISPQGMAAKAGATRVVYIPGATVKDPATGKTLTANVYAWGV